MKYYKSQKGKEHQVSFYITQVSILLYYDVRYQNLFDSIFCYYCDPLWQQVSNHVSIEAGCPDLSPPAHAWYKRDGDQAVIGCEWSQKTWHLSCDGHSWSGVVGNCSEIGNLS